ncbi:translocon-associated protein subunit alpha-like [Uranotaenia lowii]|uniref:translocon-associated protein subunit alpha-like n=1 Tax=Uranotaenia lowii TaxID=190385 RepID=UPI00247A464D|nr:translocon-associated protein subunit alpha-like [Uranotaenia lowii]
MNSVIQVAEPAVLLTADNGSRFMANATEDELDEELDVEVESDEASVTQNEEPETDEEPETTKSRDADTFLLFTRNYVTGTQLELPAGNPVEFLVGFANKRSDDFIVKILITSFKTFRVLPTTETLNRVTKRPSLTRSFHLNRLAVGHSD